MVQNRGGQLQAVTSTFVSLAFVAVLLRIYVRLRLVRAFGWDDAFMVCAMLMHIMFATCVIGGVHYGTGQHMKDLSRENIIMAMRYWWLCYLSYCLCMIAAKISIGLFLLRVTVKAVHRWIIITVMSLTVLTGVIFFFVVAFQCTPVSHFWNRWLPDGKCLNIDVIIGLGFLYSAISAICDFTFGILPVFMVWNLNMSQTSKLALIPILSMACVASTAVLVRMAYIMCFKSDDFLYDTTDIAIWSDVEQGLAITAGSLATLRPLYRMITERLGLLTTGASVLKTSRKGTPSKMTSSNNRLRKHHGPFSLVSITRHNTTYGHDSDEESLRQGEPPVPRHARHVPLQVDQRSEASSEGKEEKGFSSWRVEAGGSSEEDLPRSPSPAYGGILCKTDVVMRSEPATGARR